MGRRQYPWVLADVPWSLDREWTRGTHYGLPLLSWNTAPRDVLATRRQLTELGLRPNGQEPVAYLYFRCRRALKIVFAELFLISGAAPKRTATPAQHTALAKANLARRICRSCGKDRFYVPPREWGGRCEPCWLASPDSHATVTATSVSGDIRVTSNPGTQVHGADATRCPAC